MAVPPFSLSRATVDDLTELVELEYECFPADIRELFMGAISKDYFPRVVAKYRAEMEEDPHDIWMKVTTLEEGANKGRIIAAANWKVYPSSAPEISFETPPSWLEGSMMERSKELIDQVNKKRKEANPGGYIYLHICFTDAAYRRRGAGQMLLKWGCDVADQLFIPGWVEASTDGSALYRTFGFEGYEKVLEPMPVLNMRREPSMTGIAGGKSKPSS